MFKKGLLLWIMLMLFPTVVFWEVNPVDKCNTANSYVNRFTESLRWDIKWTAQYNLDESNIAHHQRIADFYCPKISAYLEKEKEKDCSVDNWSIDKCWKIEEEIKKENAKQNEIKQKQEQEQEEVKKQEQEEVKKQKKLEDEVSVVLDDVPEVKKLDAQLDIIENPNSTDEEKEAAYEKLEAEWIDTGDWWFSSSNAEDARKSINAKKDEVKKTLAKPELSKEQVIEKAREDIWDTSGMTKEEISRKMSSKVNEINKEQKLIKETKEKWKLNKDAVHEAEAKFEVANTSDAKNAIKKEEETKILNAVYEKTIWEKQKQIDDLNSKWTLTTKEQAELNELKSQKELMETDRDYQLQKQKPTLEEKNALEKYNKALDKKEKVTTAVNNGWVVKSEQQEAKESYESCKPATSDKCNAKKDLYEATQANDKVVEAEKDKEKAKRKLAAAAWWMQATCNGASDEDKRLCEWYKETYKEWVDEQKEAKAKIESETNKRDSLEDKKEAVEIEEWLEKAKKEERKACKNPDSAECKVASASVKDKEDDRLTLKREEAELEADISCKKPSSKACKDANEKLDKAQEAEDKAFIAAAASDDEVVKAKKEIKENKEKEVENLAIKTGKACEAWDTPECRKAIEEMNKKEAELACLEPDSQACKDAEWMAQSSEEMTWEYVAAAAAEVQKKAEEAAAAKKAKDDEEAANPGLKRIGKWDKTLMESLLWYTSDTSIIELDSKDKWGFTILSSITVWLKDSISSLIMLVSIWAFLYVWIRLGMARWNPEEFKKALMQMIYIIVGIFIVTLAWAAVYLVAWLNI